MKTNMITIEKDIPIPPIRRGKYPFKQMQVGDSFFLPCANSQEQSISLDRVKSSCHFRLKHHGERYHATKINGGVRVWLVERETL